ncbi:hypothetical protein [Halomonas hibernica]|uniref:hypothetical protein n=1 Tax=Halomonas hibernica TaxID=2591147 RepID=UPI001555B327|nr:hypothetical protein [Halomonas hibernica]
MADMTLNPIALLKTGVVIVAFVAVGYLNAEFDNQAVIERNEQQREERQSQVEPTEQESTPERQLGAIEREQQERQAELESMTPEERERAAYVELWGEERAARRDAEKIVREAATETRTYAEMIAERQPESSTPPQHEPKTRTFGDYQQGSSTESSD